MPTQLSQQLKQCTYDQQRRITQCNDHADIQAILPKAQLEIINKLLDEQVKQYGMRVHSRGLINALIYSCVAIDLCWAITALIPLASFSALTIALLFCMAMIIIGVGYFFNVRELKQKAQQNNMQYKMNLIKQTCFDLLERKTPECNDRLAQRTPHAPSAFQIVMLGFTASLTLFFSYGWGLNEIMMALKLSLGLAIVSSPIYLISLIAIAVAIGVGLSIKTYQAKQHKAELLEQTHKVEQDVLKREIKHELQNQDNTSTFSFVQQRGPFSLGKMRPSLFHRKHGTAYCSPPRNDNLRCSTMRSFAC